MWQSARGRTGARKVSAATLASAITVSVLTPLTFIAIDALPAEALTGANTPSPSPSATCAAEQCGPSNFAFPANGVSATTSAGTPVVINVLAHDCDSTLPGQTYNMQTTSVSLTGPKAGTITVNSAYDLVFTPAKGFTGKASYYYGWQLIKGYEINPANGQRIPINGASSLATLTITVSAGHSSGQSTGLLAGILESVGGTAPGSSKPIAGVVSIHGPRGTTTTKTASDGKFSAVVIAGSYMVTGRSPLYQAGKVNCAAARAVTVRRGATKRVVVVCKVK